MGKKKKPFKPYLSARIAPELMARLEAMAAEERRSISQMTVILLEEALDARQNRKEMNAAD